MDYNTIILWKGYGELSELEYGDLIFGIDSRPQEIARFKIEDESKAKAELSKYRCTYWKRDSYVRPVIMGEEYGLEYSYYDEDGEFIEGSDFELAEIAEDSEYILGDDWQNRNKLVKNEKED